MRDRSVLISGIGVAGPTLAYWLGRQGCRVTLVDHAPALRTGGYVIDFWGLGFDVAERMGLVPTLRREGYRVEALRLVDARGRRTGGFGADVFRLLTEGRYVSLPRGDLAAALFRTIEGAHECRFGDSIAALEQDRDGVAVSFEHAPARRFDLVIGADGLHSRVRRLAFGDQARFERYLGYVVAAFEATGYRPRDEGVYVSYGAPGKQIARFALAGDRTLFLLVLAAEAPPAVGAHDIAAQKRLLSDAFADAGWESTAILAALDEAEALYFDRVSQIRMDRWSHGRVALVGDAAFAPSLLAGQGAALAMTAAFVLAGELGRADGAAGPAFARYEGLLRPFMAGKQDAARRFAASFVPRTRAGLWLRAQVTKAFGIPGVARLVLGRSLLDRLQLPDYMADS